MGSARKAALCLLFFAAFFLSPLIYAQSIPGDDILNKHLDAELSPDEEDLLIAEPSPVDEITLSEEPPPYEKTASAGELAPAEEITLSAETSPDEDPFSEEDTDHLFYADSDFVYYAESRPPRSFDEIFPDLTRTQRRRAMTTAGLRFYFEKNENPQLSPAVDSGIDLLGRVMDKGPSHIIEALLVVPHKGKELDMLDTYNALSRISNIKDHSVMVGDRDINIFTETTRVQSARRMNPVSDPPPAVILPLSETMYLRFEDAFFGNLYIRGDVLISSYGITYDMTNFKTVRYYLLPIMKAEKFTAIIYLEPIKEGILIYSMSGIYIPGFVADKVNLTPNINRRLSVLISWITDGLSQVKTNAE